MRKFKTPSLQLPFDKYDDPITAIRTQGNFILLKNNKLRMLDIRKPEIIVSKWEPPSLNGSVANGLTFSEDFVSTVDSETQSLYLMDPTNLEVLQSVRLPLAPTVLSWNSECKQLAVGTTEGRILIYGNRKSSSKGVLGPNREGIRKKRNC